MAKRRLNKHQIARISNKQKKDDAAILDTKLPSNLDAEQSGFVIAHFGTQVLVQSTVNPELRQRALLPANVPPLVVGDKVRWQPSNELGAINSRLERTSTLARPDHRGFPRVVAANIDTLFIMVAPTPPTYANLIDRYLVAAKYHQMDAAIILNKTDLPAEQLTASLEIISRYEGLGHRCYHISTKTGAGIDPLKTAMHGKTIMLAGQSGVGKSSLTNVLVADADALVGELSHASDKGRHTTTASHWYAIDEHTSLIDSPGIREFSLNHLSPSDILWGFVEIAPRAITCKFNDCSHQNIKGCAVAAAVDAGEISRTRLNSYFHLINECDTQK